jgi:hypothetical protein
MEESFLEGDDRTNEHQHEREQQVDGAQPAHAASLARRRAWLSRTRRMYLPGVLA